jgi:hypothetical protein
MAGVTALAEIRMPSMSLSGVTFVLDMGFSLTVQLGLSSVAEAFRDGLVAVASLMPESIADILPSNAFVSHCEIHLLASTSDGAAKNRQNTLADRVDLDLLKSFDAPNPDVGHQLGFAARLSGPLTNREAAELVVYGMNYMALSIGFLDPTRAETYLRSVLSLPSEPIG